MIEKCDELGFRVAAAKICAADYGVPQTRVRAFVLGSKFADPNSYFPPQQTHWKPDANLHGGNNQKGSRSCENWSTLRDAIADLPPPEGTELRSRPAPLDIHFGRCPTEKSMARYRAIPSEGMNRFDLARNAPELVPLCWKKKKHGGSDLFGRLWWDKPSVTIRTEFFKPEKGRYLHPEQHRPITHREAARIQSFPDDFVFHGSKAEIAKQIGNAVPPLLAAKIAKDVYRMFLDGANGE